MIFRSLLICCYLSVIISCESPFNTPGDNCLPGYMTGRQSWVNGSGALNVRRSEINYSVDLSYTKNPVSLLRQIVHRSRLDSFYIKYLSLANCGLTRVPLIFQMSVGEGLSLSDKVEFMTFYGNHFDSIHYPVMEYEEIFNATDSVTMNMPSTSTNHEAANIWSSSLQQTDFPNLKELDLRACSIKVLSSLIFQGMKSLEALYLGENGILHIHSEAFVGLQNLLHLDFSRNNPRDKGGQPQNLITDTFLVFEDLVNLESLDLSHTRLDPRQRGMIMGSNKKLKSLSICNTGLTVLHARIFSEMSLEILDLSNNHEILIRPDILRGLENTLRILYASGTGVKFMNIFKYFNKLEILQLSRNEISHVPADVVSSLKNLQILDLNENRITSWMNTTFSLMPKLRLLSLRDNNINMISHIMVQDISEIDYLALANNFIVCYCEAKDFFEMAAMNENKFNDTKIKELAPRENLFHTGYYYYNRMVFDRNPIVYKGNTDIEDTGRFRLIDYDKAVFTCLKVPDGISVPFFEVNNCNMSKRDLNDLANNLDTGRRLLLILLAIPCILLPILLFMAFRRQLKYFYITMRNSAMMSLINKNKMADDSTIYNYDVFVSYCNEDRGWVLDHLLPQIEADCSISACLHERDFQVGLSILENIVLCMDRSRYIMLVLSQRFLISRWCQFEMHLAQHRLLETRREDLILVLVEDIPRRMRPNTLHYLMLTKTYIVWPKEESERVLFWKRLKKTLLSEKTKLTQNVSLA